MGFTISVPLVRAVVGTVICSCTGGDPVREDATMILGLGISSLAGAARIRPMTRDTSACVILGLGASPWFFNPLSLHKWKLTFLKNFGNYATRTRRCQEIIQSPFR